MQFSPNGPDIPDALLQAHEDGRLVFFCGAGVSYLAGLPRFDGLVREVMQLAGEPPDATEGDLLKEKQFDLALGLFERRSAMANVQDDQNYRRRCAAIWYAGCSRFLMSIPV